MLKFAEQVAPTHIDKHYTPIALARHLVGLVPIEPTDRVIDPAAGASRSFLRWFPTRKRICCEISEGKDFLTKQLDYDWAITNPPYHLLWAYIDKASAEADKGFAFLVNINGINTLTPKRLELLSHRRFYLRRLHVCQVKRWFGRYYFYVFSRQAGRCRLSWDDTQW